MTSSQTKWTNKNLFKIWWGHIKLIIIHQNENILIGTFWEIFKKLKIYQNFDWQVPSFQLKSPFKGQKWILGPKNLQIDPHIVYIEVLKFPKFFQIFKKNWFFKNPIYAIWGSICRFFGYQNPFLSIKRRF